MKENDYDICIVSVGCVSTGPRVEKEADALSAAGYRVAVLVCHWIDGQREWDERIAATRPWRLLSLDWTSTVRKRSLKGLASIGLYRAAKRIGASVLPLDALAGLNAPLAALACSDRLIPLSERALRVPARLYMAHNLGALPVVALAAKARNARFSFDAEDDHFGELPIEDQQGAQGRIVNAVLQRHLPRAAFVTAAADGSAQALATRHGIEPPVTVLNAFPLSMRKQLDGLRKERTSDALSLCWYSQTVGLDRGLQDVIRALGRVRGAFQLHLRGTVDPDVARTLRALATEHGIAECIHFSPQVHPDELLSRVAEHDIGLALEHPVSDNRRVAVTNKLFFYMLAGLAVVATSTPGQSAFVRDSGGALAAYEPGDIAALTAHLQALHDDRALLEARKRQALSLALTRYNADLELTKLLPLVARALAR